MAQAAKTIQDREESKEFAALLESSMEHQAQQGSVVKGRIIEVQNDAVIVDVGLKSEGRVSLREFATPGQDPEIRVGDEVEVFVDRINDLTAISEDIELVGEELRAINIKPFPWSRDIFEAKGIKPVAARDRLVSHVWRQKDSEEK